MKFMLDTNICIYAIKGGNTHLDQRLDECETGDLVMSAITLGELEAGFVKSTDPGAARQQAAAVFQAVTVVPFDEAAARAFGQVQSEAPARRGAYDRQIAAHAISLGLTVVTNNEQDFEGISRLPIDNWTRPASDQTRPTRGT